MVKKVSLIILGYFLPNLLSSCINCGENPKNYLESITGLEVIGVSNLEENFLERYEALHTESLSFALNLKIRTLKEQASLSMNDGYSCFACSLPPAYLASNISSISIAFSSDFEGVSAGQNLRELFVIDPVSFYQNPFSFMTISEFENLRDGRSPDEIRFIYNDVLNQNYKGAFTVTLTSDGKSFTSISDNIEF